MEPEVIHLLLSPFREQEGLLVRQGPHLVTLAIWVLRARSLAVVGVEALLVGRMLALALMVGAVAVEEAVVLALPEDRPVRVEKVVMVSFSSSSTREN